MDDRDQDVTTGRLELFPDAGHGVSASEAGPGQSQRAALPAGHLAEEATAIMALGARQARQGELREAVKSAERSVRAWRQVVAEAPEHVEDLAKALHLLSGYLGKVARPEAAVVAGQESVTLMRSGVADPPKPAAQVTLMLALTVLGNHLLLLGRRTEGMDVAREAAETGRSLLDSPATVDLSDEQVQSNLVATATALGNYGLHLRTDGRRTEALAAENEANALWRRLAEADRFYEPELAASLSNMGIHLAETGRHGEGLSAEEEAVAIRRRLDESSSEAHGADLARSLSNLAVRLVENERWEEAEAASREAVERYRQLVRLAATVYEVDLARSLSQRGTIVYHLSGPGEALKPVAEASRVYGTLARANAEAHDEDLARVLAFERQCLIAAGTPQDTVGVVSAEVEVLRRLSRRLPHRTPDLSMVLNQLATLLDGLGDVRGSMAARDEAVEVLTDFTEDFPEEGQPYLAAALIEASEQHSEVGEFDEALELGERGIAVVCDLIARGGDTWRTDLGNSLANRGLWLSSVGRDEEALQATDEALATYGLPPAEGPRLPPSWLARVLRMKSQVLRRLQRYSEMLAVYAELLPLLTELEASAAGSYAGELAEVLTLAGRAECIAGNVERGTGLLGQGVLAYDSLVQAGAPDALESRISAVLELSAALDEASDPDGALAHAERGESLSRELPAGVAVRQELLAQALRHHAMLLARAGDTGRAVVLIREAVELLQDRAGNSGDATDVLNLADALSQLAVLLVHGDDVAGALAAVRRQVGELAAADAATGVRLGDSLLKARNQLYWLLVHAPRTLAERPEMAALTEGADVMRDVVASLREASARDAGRYEPHLTVALLDLAFVLLSMGQPAEGASVAEEGVGFARRLWADVPEEQHRVGMLLDLLGACLTVAGDIERARQIAGEAVTVWRQLREAGHPAGTEDQVARAEAQLRRLCPSE
jgi:tetratricopeptide (TPR) repeat protein